MKKNIFLCNFLAIFLFLLQGDIAGADISLSQVREDFVCPPIDGYYPSGPGCNQLYYLCFNEVLYELMCPSSSVFDPNTLTCVIPEDCSATETTELLTTFTTELQTTSTTEATTMTDSTSIRTTPSGPTGIRRTVVFIRFDSQPGQFLFIKGGISTTLRPECSGATSAVTSPCAIPITVMSLGTAAHYSAYDAFRVGDNYLDFFGKEPTQGSFGTEQPYGTPLIWTTNDPADIQGRYQPLNTYGPNYWMVDFDMDCDKTENGWFELIGTDNANEEAPVNQDLYCGGSSGGIVGAKPYESTYHMGYCGYINVYEFGRRLCEIDSFPVNTNSLGL